MNLVQRLKEPYLKSLKNANEKYPTIMAEVFDELETKSFYTEITYGAWLHIHAFTKANHPADIFK